MALHYLSSLSSDDFPDPAEALRDPNGLLAIGGSLDPARLLAAYKKGIFPWYNENQPILWWSPDPRAVLFLDEFHYSRSLKKLIKAHVFSITINQATESVIEQCAFVRNQATWLLPEMIIAYKELI